MSDPASGGRRTADAATPSLVIQRLALERAGVVGVVVVVAAGIGLILSLLILVLGGSVWTWIAIVVFVALLIVGVRQRAVARAALTQFEAANGRDAGRQVPVT